SLNWPQSMPGGPITTGPLNVFRPALIVAALILFFGSASMILITAISSAQAIDENTFCWSTLPSPYFADVVRYALTSGVLISVLFCARRTTECGRPPRGWAGGGMKVQGGGATTGFVAPPCWSAFARLTQWGKPTEGMIMSWLLTFPAVTGPSRSVAVE